MTLVLIAFIGWAAIHGGFFLYLFFKGTTAEEFKWLITVAATLLVLVPVIIIDHIKLARKVKREANVRKLSNKYITKTGDIVRIQKGVRA